MCGKLNKTITFVAQSLLIFGCWRCPAVCAQLVGASGGARLDDAISNERPAFLVHAALNEPSAEYREGDLLSVRVKCEMDAYIYALYQQADGKVFQVFPNSEQRENFLKAGQETSIPAKGDLFRWIVGPPFGREVLKIVASKQPVRQFANPRFSTSRFIRFGAPAVKSVAASLAKERPAAWAEVDLNLVTHPREYVPERTDARRYGVFFGVSEYEFHEESIEATGVPMNLHACVADADVLSRAMVAVGGLADAKVFVNDQATRANLKEAIMRWLPLVSKPGDTVFIYYSGHGSVIPDDNGDEQDEADELLLPHDFCPPTVYVHLMKKFEQGLLSPAKQRRLAELDAIVRPYLENGSGDKAEVALKRATGLTDDVFGRWLQRLYGRRVVVLLDSCFSGGFGAPEKGFRSAQRQLTFDFLDTELGRLKDIGQAESAMISACLASQTALERGGHGVFTRSVLKSLERLSGPTVIEETYRFCERDMREYFEELNTQQQQAGKEPYTPHQPHMVNHCSRPVIIKPQ